MDDQCESSVRDALLANGEPNAASRSPRQQHDRGDSSHPLLPT